MTEQKPETLTEYFSLQIKKLAKWVKPDPSDTLILQVIKTIWKGIAVLLMLIFSPVLILGLTLAFVTAF